MTTFTVAGEELELCSERAVRWRRVLLVADPHFGKAASFRALGVHVPSGTTTFALDRLDAVIARLPGTERIIFLGDFLHAKEGRSEETFEAITRWRAAHANIAMQIVRGNHDKRAGDPPASVGMQCIDGPVIEGPFALTHHPIEVTGKYVLAGHVHPCAVLIGPARQRERLPCFWFSEARQVGVLPAFGEFTGCAEVEPVDGDDVYVIADRSVRRYGTR